MAARVDTEWYWGKLQKNVKSKIGIKTEKIKN